MIVHSDLLLEYLKINYPELYFVSSTTKVLTDFQLFMKEVNREDFLYAVPDFRLNKSFDKWKILSQSQKDKVEFLCNECCWFGCTDRKSCYETVSRKTLERTVRSITVRLLTPVMATVFQRQWKIPDLSVSTI